MILCITQTEYSQGGDPEYDEALQQFYSPYHGLVDVMCRLAINHNCMTDNLINLSAMVGFEAVPLHLTFFPKLWLDIHHAQVSCSYSLLLVAVHRICNANRRCSRKSHILSQFGCLLFSHMGLIIF